MKVINIALKREDGKIECDTVFAEKMLTQEDVDLIAEKHNCGVLVVCVGTFTPDDDETQKQNTFVKEFNNGTSESDTETNDEE